MENGPTKLLSVPEQYLRLSHGGHHHQLLAMKMLTIVDDLRTWGYANRIGMSRVAYHF